jgi:hypothetical protein
MAHTQIPVQTCYRGYSISPFAAYDGGLYAAMVIIGDQHGRQRASGILGHFASAEEACAYAAMFGREEVDCCVVHLPTAY